MRAAAESSGAGAPARELAAQAQVQLARARLARRGAQIREAVEARLDVRAAVQRRAWGLLAAAFAVGFWMGRGANRWGDDARH